LVPCAGFAAAGYGKLDMIAIGKICNPGFVQDIEQRPLGFDPNRMWGHHNLRGHPWSFPRHTLRFMGPSIASITSRIDAWRPGADI
jgi:hypothetical protein